MSYQSFPGTKGASKSEQKLERLKLPQSLTGKSVLDIGCNEGFFALDAAERGAVRVVGMDRELKFVESARERARSLAQVSFEHGDAKSLPNERFDYVYLLSALHYFDDPYALFSNILNVLKPGGTLVLECGVANGEGATVKRALRSIDERFFPTSDMLVRRWLKDFAVRLVSHSVPQAGDPVPRFVFHCTPLQMSVAFVVGEGGIGKTHLARQIDHDAVVINADAMLRCDRAQGGRLHPSQIAFDEAKSRYDGSIRLAWNDMARSDEHRRYFAGIFAKSIQMSRPASLVIVEGYAMKDMVSDIQARLGNSFHCWTIDKMPPSNRG